VEATVSAWARDLISEAGRLAVHPPVDSTRKKLPFIFEGNCSGETRSAPIE
jgi:hypothetical protein